MIQNFASVLRDKLRIDMNNYADDLSAGTCRSFEEYQKLCGVIQGLALAERHLIDLVEKAEKEENNE